MLESEGNICLFYLWQDSPNRLILNWSDNDSDGVDLGKTTSQTHLTWIWWEFDEVFETFESAYKCVRLYLHLNGLTLIYNYKNVFLSTEELLQVQCQSVK